MAARLLRDHLDRPALLFQLRADPDHAAVPAELKPGVSKYIAPKALFYFRWGAAFTVLTGLFLAYLYDELVEALLLRRPSCALIGIGMWLALIMAFNVWFVIWPNQQRALGLVEADDATKAKSARTAMLAVGTNTLLSIPMLLRDDQLYHLGARQRIPQPARTLYWRELDSAGSPPLRRQVAGPAEGPCKRPSSCRCPRWPGRGRSRPPPGFSVRSSMASPRAAGALRALLSCLQLQRYPC